MHAVELIAKFSEQEGMDLSNVDDISFQEYVSDGFSHPVFYGDLIHGCGMQTEDAYSVHLVLSHFGTYMCSNVETNPS